MLMSPGNHRSIGHRHGLLGVRPSDAFSRFEGYKTGYNLGRLQALAQTVAGIAGIVFTFAVVIYTMI